MKRNFMLGSDWIYIKIYCGFKTAEIILTNKILPVALSLKKENIICKWFFIRYADPDFHLRVRFHLKEIGKYNIVVNLLKDALEPYVLNDVIWKIQYDTYQREIERYGEKNMEDIEAIFHVDSEVIALIILNLNYDDNKYQIRWMLALLLIDKLLSSFNLPLKKKREIMKNLDNAYKKEFSFNIHQYKVQIDTKYRNYKSTISKVINLEDNLISHYILLIDKRTQTIDILAKKILEEDISNVDYVIASLVHMTMNRLFQSKNRLHELVIYDFLDRFYFSEIFKSKNNLAAKQPN